LTLCIREGALEVEGARLLESIDFDLAPGEVAAVVGANGAGKSSLVRVMSADLPPSSGEVLIDGKRLGSVPRMELARRLAVLPQHSLLDFPFRSREVIEMGRIPHFTGAILNKRLVAEVIELLMLSALQDRVYTTLSGGERQRVQIARVLCQLWDCLGGGYLLFDEPTAPLDLAHQLGFLHIARRLAEKHAGVLLVMHDINLATRFADSVAIMKGGRIIARGSPREVVTEENMRVAFDVDVAIMNTTDGAPMIYTRATV
jgi:iron complex transport system ATP-binding protein